MTMILDPIQKIATARVNEGRNVFLTGSAGTGKSSVTVEIIRKRLGDRGLKVCATTGVAALNLRDKLSSLFGCHVDTSTIYRWAGIGIGPQNGQSFDEYLGHMRSRKFSWYGTNARIQATKTLVIDEISMLPGKTLQFIDFVCKHVRGSNEPFGGIQVLCVGDFLQLPPVAKTGGYDWAFETDTWHDLGFSNVTLQTVHRQADPMFVDVLNQFREGSITKAGAAILKPRVARFPKCDILRLMTHNTQVAKWNAYQLGAIDGESHEIKATFDGATADCDFLRKNLITPESLLIKRQARVMVTSNIAGNGESLAAANGDMGVVVDWSDQAVIVKLDNGTLLPLQAKTWSFDPMDKKSATMTQIPLKLAWATTIHKSQGLTLDNALIDIRATREPGQAYVAISRVRRLSGLHLKDWFSGIWVSPVAKAFHKQIA